MASLIGSSIESRRKPIIITYIVNPQLFWFKFNENKNEKLLSNTHPSFQMQIDAYVKNYVTNELLDAEEPINNGSVVLVFCEKNNKWIRARIESFENIADKHSPTNVWAMDYGQVMESSLDVTIPLNDTSLASYPIKDLHIGGLSDVAAAELDIFTKVHADHWSEKAIEYFRSLIEGVDDLVFEMDTYKKDRYFGKLEIHLRSGKTLLVNEKLCEHPDVLEHADYKNDIPPLDHENYIRFNQKHTIAKPISFVLADSLEEIDRLSSRRYGSIGGSHVEEAKEDVLASIQHSVYSYRSSGMMSPDSFSSDNVIEFEDVAIVTDDCIAPTIDWSGTFYFPTQMQTCLTRDLIKINQIESFVWPHVMRMNSAIIIDEMEPSISASLPVFCARVLQMIEENRRPSTSIEPFAILLTANAAQAETLTKKCAYLFEQSSEDPVKIYYLNGSHRIQKMIEAAKKKSFDVLVCSVFCFAAVLEQIPVFFDSKRLNYVHFHRIDEMWQIDQKITENIVEKVFLRNPVPQTMVTSGTHCLILHIIFANSLSPLLAISKRVVFEAAIFAKTNFIATLEDKYKDLVDKLRSLSGSIVIVCKDQTEIQHLSTHLYKHQIDHLAVGDAKAIHRIVVNRWIFESKKAQQNILLTDDKLIRACSTKYARHIVHFWMPTSLHIFLQRLEVCFSTYAEQLNDALVERTRNPFKAPSQSILYVNDEWQGFLDIIQLINCRIECDIPLELRETLKTLLESKERHNASRTLCKELITKGVNCNYTCPYRHSLNRDDEQTLPKHGFVKMRLLEILAPNHYAVQIEQHRHSIHEKWQTYNEMEKAFASLNEWMQRTYAKPNRKFAETVRLGDMYAIKCMPESEYRRCRVLTQNDKTTEVTVYLVDFGKTMTCKPRELLEMYKELKVPQSKAIEIILLGMVPADCEREFLESASKTIKKCVDKMQTPDTNTYLMAEIKDAFDSTLLVNDLKLVNIERKESINIIKSLIKIKYAIEIPIKLHDIFHEREAKTSFESISIGYDSSIREISSSTIMTEKLIDPSIIAEKPFSESFNFIEMDNEMEQFESPALGDVVLIDLSDDAQTAEPPLDLFPDVQVISSIDDLL